MCGEQLVQQKDISHNYTSYNVEKNRIIYGTCWNEINMLGSTFMYALLMGSLGENEISFSNILNSFVSL